MASGKHIGFANQHPHSHYWLLVEHGARERAAELGITLSILPATTLDEQIAAIHHLVRKPVAALLLGSVAATGLATTITSVEQAHIPVIAVATEPQDCRVTCTVESDHRTGAMDAARYMVEQLGGTGAVAHLMGPQHLKDNVERARGVRTVLKQYPAIDLVFERESPDWQMSSGAALMRAALVQAPHVRAVCAANDTLALGALEAIDAVGRTGQIVVTGFDAMPAALLAIHEGRLSATVRQSMRAIGRTAVDVAWRAARGEAVESHVVIDVALTTRTNLIEAALEPLTALPRVLSDAIERGEALALARDATIAAQQQVLHALATPLIPITDTVMVMPLIGKLDAVRMHQIMETLLARVAMHATHIVIIDLTGVPNVDTQVAQALVGAAQAARLVGTQVVLTGIRPDVAHTLVHLGGDLRTLLIRSTLQSGIAYALQHRA